MKTLITLLAVASALSACNMHNAGTAPKNISDGTWTAGYTPLGAPLDDDARR